MLSPFFRASSYRSSLAGGLASALMVLLEEHSALCRELRSTLVTFELARVYEGGGGAASRPAARRSSCKDLADGGDDVAVRGGELAEAGGRLRAILAGGAERLGIGLVERDRSRGELRMVAIERGGVGRGARRGASDRRGPTACSSPSRRRNTTR